MEETLEEKLVKEYIGKGADEIISSKTNWSAAILGQFVGPAWFFYKKSYLLGFAFVIITNIIGLIAVKMNFSKAYYIMFIIYLCCANQLYIWDVKRKVRKILEKNENVSEEELVNIVRKKVERALLLQ